MSIRIRVRQLLDDISSAPIQNTSFPTHFNILLRLKPILDKKNSNVNEVVTLIRADPMLASEVVKAANTAAMRRSGTILDIEKAVLRLGFVEIRKIALEVSLFQISKAKETLRYAHISRALWLNSLYIASAARVIAKINNIYHPEEAFFVGLIHNLGRFYLLHQYARHDVFKNYQDDMKNAIDGRGVAATRKILKAQSYSSAIFEWLSLDTVDAESLEREPVSQSELIYAAVRMSDEHMPWNKTESEPKSISDFYDNLVEEVQEDYVKTLVRYR